ncbi:MAG: carbohydrate ABC transporter permease [Treponema sp.]|nr:carbohydrate ABC transporter permease [Treponema sp.]
MNSFTRAMKRYFIHALMIFFGLLAIVPIYVLLINSTRSTEQINTGFTFLPGLDGFFSSTSTIIADWDKPVSDLIIEDGEELTEEDTDHYTGILESVSQSLDENKGIVVYKDLIMDITLREAVNKNGIKEKYVVKALTESRSPRIEIINSQGVLLATYHLSNNAQLFVNDGEVIQKDQMIVITHKPSNIMHNWRALTGRGFQIWQGFGNSAFISICATLLSIYFSALTAYGLHIYRFRGRALIWGIILLIMMLPGSLTFIGFYQLMVTLNLTGTFFPLILPGIAAAATVLFIRQYMSSVLNRELIDAARIDGAGEFSIFNIVILPVIIPALAAQSIFTFVGSWNNYLIPAVILANNEKMHTLPMLIMSLRGDIYRTEFGGIYLGIAVSLIPIMIFYAFMSRYIISGITMGGIKE